MEIVLCRLHGIVSENMYCTLLQAIKRVYKKKASVLTLHINSEGGSMKWAVKIHEALLSCKKNQIEVIAVGYKKVHSAALMIYMSCVFRTGYKETKFLIHRSRSVKGSEKNDHKILEKEFYEYFSGVTLLPFSEFIELADASTYLSFDIALSKKICNLNLEKSLLSI